MPYHKAVNIERYEQYVGAEMVDRIRSKAERLTDCHVVHINSTFYGGGVAELLSSDTLLMNSLGIKTGWRVIQGSPDFFSITKKMHNALQGGEINLSELKVQIYEEVIMENAVRNHLDHDIVVIHDPQPLPMVEHYRKRGPWIWRCHVDLSQPHRELWSYLTRFVEKYDAVVLSLPEYRQELKVPQLFSMPAINPFSLTNVEMSEEAIMERLNHYKIPTDLPLVVQISRFDKWKDPEGAIKAFKLARHEVDCTLVLLGNVATDDPEGEEVFDSLLRCKEDRIHILSYQDSALVNSLQRKAAVVLQKSIREGFGLTVAEAMWKGTPVIGGNAGGIRYQIQDGVNGFLVTSYRDAAVRISTLLKDEKLRRAMGARARETVRKHLLLPRLVEEQLDLYNSFQSNFRFAPSNIPSTTVQPQPQWII